MKPLAILPKRLFFENQTYNDEPIIKVSFNVLKKIKISLNKLSPLHWYDGVWENLDYKM